MLQFKTITKASKKKRAREVGRMLANSASGSCDVLGNSRGGYLEMSPRNSPGFAVAAGSGRLSTRFLSSSKDGESAEDKQEVPWTRHVRMSDVPKFVTAAQTKAAIAAGKAATERNNKRGLFRIQSSEPVFRNPPAACVESPVKFTRSQSSVLSTLQQTDYVRGPAFRSSGRPNFPQVKNKTTTVPNKCVVLPPGDIPQTPNLMWNKDEGFQSPWVTRCDRVDNKEEPSLWDTARSSHCEKGKNLLSIRQMLEKLGGEAGEGDNGNIHASKYEDGMYVGDTDDEDDRDIDVSKYEDGMYVGN